MTTRTEIIAQIDDEISRLLRARDFLATAIAGSKTDSKTAAAITSFKKAKSKISAQKRKRPAIATPSAANGVQSQAMVAPPPPPPKEEPQVHRVPPKRRMERRHQGEKAGKSAAALSGLVPAGPVAVSADEARKVQERAVQTPPAPIANEPRPEIGAERSLGSLIQAFERRAGLSGLETS